MSQNEVAFQKMQLVCLICNKKLIYEHSDITPLVRHLNQEHPRINISKTHKSQQTNQIPQKFAADLITFGNNSVAFRKSVEKSVQTELKLDWSKYFRDYKNTNRKMESQENQGRIQERRKSSGAAQDENTRRESRNSEESLNISNKSSKKNSEESVESQPKFLPKPAPKSPSPKTSKVSKPAEHVQLPETSQKTVENTKKFSQNKTPEKKRQESNKPQSPPDVRNNGEGDFSAHRKKKLYVISGKFITFI